MNSTKISTRGQLADAFAAHADSGAEKCFTKGTHRLVPPEETVARVSRFMPVMGITRIANVTGLDKIGIPVVMVCRPNSRSVSVSQGKGANLAAAKASGLMESIESYHAERITLPLKCASYEDLRYTHRMIDIERLPRRTDSRFTPHSQLLWIEGRNLFDDQALWIPYELVHLNYTLPMPTGHGCFIASSNGLASGNHALEAISHGICEVVERDATTLWHLLDENGRERTRINLDSVDDPRCRDTLDRFAAANVLVAVWETTSDVGIPAFLCRILEADAPPRSSYRPSSGMGCHPSREVALLRALTEAAQSRLTFISGARDDMTRGEYEKFLDRDTYETWHADMSSEHPGKDIDQVPTWQANSFEDDLSWEMERLRAVGIDQIVVLDLTKSEFGVPVFRVVIPGLEGIDSSPKYVFGPRAQAIMKGGVG